MFVLELLFVGGGGLNAQYGLKPSTVWRNNADNPKFAALFAACWPSCVSVGNCHTDTIKAAENVLFDLLQNHADNILNIVIASYIG